MDSSKLPHFNKLDRWWTSNKEYYRLISQSGSSSKLKERAEQEDVFLIYEDTVVGPIS